MSVIDIARIDRSMADRVGAKAAGLGAMLAAGERVPAGFCLTVEAYRCGQVPERELADACRALGNGPVAVRSSATAEDLPDASSAGQQDTYLNVRGTDAVLRAVRDCWGSLRTERAVAYRADHRIPDEGLAMAVIVQRMVDARIAGVLFTANPLTGCRTETVLDAAPGLGSAVVDGTVVADHYVLDGTGSITRSTSASDSGRLGGRLGADQLGELWRAGQRMQRHFGIPQDIEWAYDADGVLWLLQARPITTLFPLPDERDRTGPRAYLEVGHMQGMLRPITPMGMATLQRATAFWCEECGIPAHPDRGHPSYVHIGGRMFVDLTDILRSRSMRKDLPDAIRVYGPRVAAVTEQVLQDPRFSPRRGSPFRPRTLLRVSVRVALPAIGEVVRTLVRPGPARDRAFARVTSLSARTAVPPNATTAERLRRAEELQRPFMATDMGGVLWPLLAGLLASRMPGKLLVGLGTEAEFARITGGMPHNVTTEMDVALWRLAEDAREHRTLLLQTPPSELAARYLEGELPDIGLADFLATYGHRAAAEIDVGVPRWSEDPGPLFATIANYLRVTDPEQAPDRRFERAAAEAENTIASLARRARRRPIRGRLAVFFMRRTRELGGLRELGKFAWVIVLREMREQLLAVGDDLVDRGLLDGRDDVMFLDFPEAHQAVAGRDQRALVERRRATYHRERNRRSVPIMLLSDGTDVEATMPAGAAVDPGTLVGMGAAPGRVTGRARVVHDPDGARLEPGEILVAPTTDPGWTPLFMSAGGLVAETGALVAHGPTVAREYGLPAVICVREATTAIRTGQRITVDGSAGTVRLEDD